MSILIAYASAKGSTREIAERIADKLRESDPSWTVNCSPINTIDVTSLPSYTSVIVGSAIHAAAWLNPARNFIHNNAVVLKQKPLWAFSVGMPPREEARKKEEQLIERKIRKTLPNLRHHELFEGRFSKQDLPWFGRIIVSCCIPKEKAKFGDARDWVEINTWTEAIGKEITALSAGET